MMVMLDAVELDLTSAAAEPSPTIVAHTVK
jgi:hypothetical protein